REYEEQHGEREDRVGLEELEGVDDEKPQSMLRSEHLGQNHSEQSQRKAYPEARNNLGKSRREQYRENGLPLRQVKSLRRLQKNRRNIADRIHAQERDRQHPMHCPERHPT